MGLVLALLYWPYFGKVSFITMPKKALLYWLFLPFQFFCSRFFSFEKIICRYSSLKVNCSGRVVLFFFCFWQIKRWCSSSLYHLSLTTQVRVSRDCWLKGMVGLSYDNMLVVLDFILSLFIIFSFLLLFLIVSYTQFRISTAKCTPFILSACMSENNCRCLKD